MKQVFLDIQEALETIRELRYIGEDWGQLNFEQPPVDFPCALIDLGGAQFSSAGRNTQQVEAIVNITIADLRFNGITPNLPNREKEKAFEIFNLIEEVNKMLHGHGGETFSRLCRVGIKKMLREDAVREFVISYKFSYTDDSAMPVLTKISAPPKITVGR